MFQGVSGHLLNKYGSFDFLNTRLSAEDNVVSAANKARWMLFHLKRSFEALTPYFFLLLYKAFNRPRLQYSIQVTHPILCRDVEALKKGAEARSEVRERTSACSV